MNIRTFNRLPIALTVLLAACNSMSGNRTEKTVDTHTSQNSLDWADTYGNDSVLVNLSKEQTYAWEERINADSIRTESGTFTWDDEGKHIVLSGVDQTYQVQENGLKPSTENQIARLSAPLTKKTPALAGVFWKLEDLNGKQPSEYGQEKERIAHLIFDEEKHMVAGSSGCNRIFGPYETGKNPGEIQFNKLGGTMMMCGSMDLEKAFTQSIAEVAKYEIQQGKLLLLDKEGKTLFRFVPSLARE